MAGVVLTSTAPLQAVGCRFDLNAGEMFLMPPRSWHYMEYEEPNISLTLAFYRSERELAEGLLGPENWSWQAMRRNGHAIEQRGRSGAGRSRMDRDGARRSGAWLANPSTPPLLSSS